MGKVISVINMKGGVGKTTLSTGIADYISNHHEKHYKTLLIDVDPQFNATQALLDLYKEDKKSLMKKKTFIIVKLKKIIKQYILYLDLVQILVKKLVHLRVRI